MQATFEKAITLVKSVVGVATGSALSLVISSCLAHMVFYTLGHLLGWELMSIFSNFLRMIYGMN
jgi:hypothetical protein